MGNVTLLNRSGLKAWFLQRVTAVIIMLYTFFVVIIVLSLSGGNSYYTWLTIFQNSWIKIFTILSFLSLMLHAWIGMWTIFTDYVKCGYIRGVLQVAAVVGYFTCFIWLICILF